MEMDPVDIKLFSNATLRGGSPADEVLKKFGERNGRISQVFRYLFKMQYFKGMHILQEYGERVLLEFVNSTIYVFFWYCI